jgi:hypothetical protein
MIRESTVREQGITVPITAGKPLAHHNLGVFQRDRRLLADSFATNVKPSPVTSVQQSGSGTFLPSPVFLK